jgi:hypothetical protein
MISDKLFAVRQLNYVKSPNEVEADHLVFQVLSIGECYYDTACSLKIMGRTALRLIANDWFPSANTRVLHEVLA